jgi:hypothetical protein
MQKQVWGEQGSTFCSQPHHSDRDNTCTSESYIAFLQPYAIIVSMSRTAKGSWQC